MADQKSGSTEKPGSLLSHLAERVRGAVAKIKDEPSSGAESPTSYPVFNAHLDRAKSSSTSNLPDRGEPPRVVSGSRLAPPAISSLKGDAASASGAEDEFEDVGEGEEETGLSQQERTSLLSTFIKEMTEPQVDHDAEEEDIPELNVKVLRDNIKRFNHSLVITKQPFTAFKQLRHWENPSATLLAMLTYFYLVLCGRLLAGSLLALLAALGYTYLKKLSAPTTRHAAKEEKIKLMDRLRVIKEAAAKVQNKFGAAADTQERAINLVTWADPARTMAVVKVLAGAFLVAVVVPFHILLPILQIAVGVKLFILDAIFARSPALRAQYDNIGHFLRTLPTNADLEYDVLPDAGPAGNTSDGATAAAATGAGGVYPASDKAARVGDALAAAGCLETAESVLDVYRAIHSGHPGRLCVTNRRVVFHHKTAPVSIALKEIAKIEKKKGFLFNTFLEITSTISTTTSTPAATTTTTTTEPLTFILFDRDAAYDSIQAQRALLKKAE